MMATLEDKILDGGKKDNYCSSSEDEDENDGVVIGSSIENDMSASSSVLRKSKGSSKNTGPKGVLQDWQDWQEHEKNMRIDKEKQLVTLCKQTALTCLAESNDRRQQGGTNVDDEFVDLFSDESLTEFIKKRMDTMLKQNKERSVFGELVEISSADEFLKTIDEADSNVIIIVHIYEKMLECDKMNECLSVVCGDYPYVMFRRIRASHAGVTEFFKSQGVPALLVYKGGNLIGNFVGLKEEFGSEFYPGDVENYLEWYFGRPIEYSEVITKILKAQFGLS